VVVNPDPRFAARDLAVVSTRRGPLLAALDAKDPSLSLYALGPDGTFTRMPGPTLPPADFPVALAAGDLNGDGLSDLVVVEGGCGEVFVYLQNAAGGFGPAPDYELTSGMGPSAVQLVDVDGDGRLDIVVANQYSGDVSVFRNVAGTGFAPESRFRAGTGLFSVGTAAGMLAVRSRLAPAGLVAGKFAAGDPVDLVVADSGANSLALLRGDGAGGFFNAEQPPSLATGRQPTVVVAGRFMNGPYLDLAVLNRESGDISIFLGDGHGGFTEKAARDANGQPIRLSAGFVPTGLAAYDIDGDGKLDLLVGNEFGDVLILRGNGDGTFEPYRRAEQKVALAVADLTGKGTNDFIFADEALDQVTVQYAQSSPTSPNSSLETSVLGKRKDGLLAPGAVKVADLNGDGIPDLIVANSGGNDVRVYLGLGNGQFAPAQKFFTGTNPAGVTVAYLNDDLVVDPTDPTRQRLIDPTPDLVVANEGSNDVTILYGEGRGNTWTLEPGPRLDAHGSGPVSTAVRYVPDARGGAAIPDLEVANSQSNTVTTLPGVGGGFFDDRNPQIHQTGIDPQQVLVGHFLNTNELDLVTIDAGSNDLTLFRNFGPGQSIGSGGDRPIAAVQGDFNHDGIDDLIIANNGDGRETLLLGRADGLAFSESFFLPGVPHPSDLAIALTGNAQAVYVSDESTPSAVLLTSFAVPIPALAGSQQPRSIADVFVLQGPGFSKALDIPSLPETSGPQAAETAGRLAEAELSALVVAPLLIGGGDPPADDQRGEQQADDDLDNFVIGQQALRSPVGAGAADAAVPPRSATELVDKVFELWPDEVGSEFIEPAFDLTGTSLTFVGFVTTAVASPLRPNANISGSLSNSSRTDFAGDLVVTGVSPTHQIVDLIFSRTTLSEIPPDFLATHRAEGAPPKLAIEPELTLASKITDVELPPRTEPRDQDMEELSRILAATLVLAQLSQSLGSAETPSARKGPVGTACRWSAAQAMI
jgi:hypothetical protein